MSCTEKSTARVLVLSLSLCWAALFAPLAEAALDNKGTEFFMAFMPNLSSPNVELHLSGDIATNVTVRYPAGAPTFNNTFAVNPGSITIVDLPASAAQAWTAGTAQDNAVRAFADDEFIVYMINRAPFTSDAALALPIDALNTDYIVASFFSSFQGGDSEFAVTGAFDNTTVTITPINALAGGFAAGVPFNVTLNRGQAFLGQGTTSGSAGDLTGTIIQADKPVALTNGNQCTNVPPGTLFCDHVFEVGQPVQTWGRTALVGPLPNRPAGSVYRILASEDTTTVQLDGAGIATINRGQFIDTGPIAGAHMFSGDKPIFVVQYMTGSQFSGARLGDPAMGSMIPSEQYLQTYTFSTVGGGQFIENFVTIIAQDSDVSAGTILLDGAAVPAGDFTAIGGTGFSFANQALVSGVHQTASNGFHGITVEGYNQDDSYLYPGGARFALINAEGDANPPVCSFTAGTSGRGTATDNRPSEDTNGNRVLDPGEDLNGNGQIDEDAGIFFIELDPGSTNLVLNVDPFTPGAGVVGYTVTVPDLTQASTGGITATDGKGNICSVPIGDLSPPRLRPFVCDGSKCLVPLKCNAVGIIRCRAQVTLFAFVPRARLSDRPAAQALRRIRFAASVVNVPPGEVRTGRLRLKRGGRQIVESGTTRRLRGLMEIRNSVGGIQTISIRIRTKARP